MLYNRVAQRQIANTLADAISATEIVGASIRDQLQNHAAGRDLSFSWYSHDGAYHLSVRFHGFNVRLTPGVQSIVVDSAKGTELRAVSVITKRTYPPGYRPVIE